MEQYATLEQIPSYFKMVNNVHTSGELKKDNSCQPSFNYFTSGNDSSVLWGSSKPIDEICPTDYKPHMGIPTHSIWNNLTKRKSIVKT